MPDYKARKGLMPVFKPADKHYYPNNKKPGLHTNSSFVSNPTFHLKNSEDDFDCANSNRHW